MSNKHPANINFNALSESARKYVDGLRRERDQFNVRAVRAEKEVRNQQVEIIRLKRELAEWKSK